MEMTRGKKGGSPQTPIGTNHAISVAAFLLFAALWLGFGVALIFSQGSLDTVWNWLRDLPMLLQVCVWLLALPVAAGLGIWETDWSTWLRLILVAGLALATLVAFFPSRWWRQINRLPA